MNRQIARRQQHRAAFQHRLHLRLAEYVDASRSRSGPWVSLSADIHLAQGPTSTPYHSWTGARSHPRRAVTHCARAGPAGLGRGRGWSVTSRTRHRRRVRTPTPPGMWCVLHLELAPTPGAVAGSGRGSARWDDVGMPYPARFGSASQPLQPVLDALARHSPTPSTTTSTTTGCARHRRPRTPRRRGLTGPERQEGHAPWA